MTEQKKCEHDWKSGKILPLSPIVLSSGFADAIVCDKCEISVSDNVLTAFNYGREFQERITVAKVEEIIDKRIMELKQVMKAERNFDYIAIQTACKDELVVFKKQIRDLK